MPLHSENIHKRRVFYETQPPKMILGFRPELYVERLCRKNLLKIIEDY